MSIFDNWTADRDAIVARDPSGDFLVADLSESVFTGKNREAVRDMIAAAPRLAKALAALVPADLDQHPGDFSQAWRDAHALLKSLPTV